MSHTKGATQLNCENFVIPSGLFCSRSLCGSFFCGSLVGSSLSSGSGFSFSLGSSDSGTFFSHFLSLGLILGLLGFKALLGS